MSLKLYTTPPKLDGELHLSGSNKARDLEGELHLSGSGKVKDLQGAELSGRNSIKKTDLTKNTDPKELADPKRSQIKEQHDPKESTIRDKTPKFAAELEYSLRQTDPRDFLIKT